MHEEQAVNGLGVHVHVPAEGLRIEGMLAVPSFTEGAVVIAHGHGLGGGAGERRIVEVLHGAGFASLVLDLLTADERLGAGDDHRVPLDAGMLATRFEHAVTWLRETLLARRRPIGYLGVDNGVAAALVAAAQRPGEVAAVACCGGRPTLVNAWLPLVRAPVLLVARARDGAGAVSARQALALLGGPATVASVAGAAATPFSHAEASDQVAGLVTGWFEDHLVRTAPARRAG